ncbi:hypothetical protein [Bradyrhizobium sp. AUGA SZCCT0283]|uniref:hypothetical protein n=1 Tax=Bradyrhizobium sp. AUGA SZCCT0283 TaxID=2807671 RepID=UPI001BAC9420|nr:hypothetical protein [Bradyrhizobium sp. AUGA SZCCT0283]MBR1274260.1 hypothetical protein [Bradyrhizobium sp. AUGA SZCCT0283]
MVQVVNQEWNRLTQEVTNAQNRLSAAQAEATRYSAMALEAAANEGAALQEKIQRESTLSALRTTKVAADLAFDTARSSLEVQLVATQKARETVEHLEREIENLRKQLVDKQAIKATIQAALDDANFLSFFFRNWSTGIDRAGSAYIETSLELSRNMIGGKSEAFELYKHWLSCHGTVFTATPYQLAEGGCNLETEYQRAQARLDQLLERVLPNFIADLIDKINKLKAHVREELKKAVEKAAIELVKFVTDPTTADFVDLLVNPQNATAAKLNEVFNVEAGAGGKRLLVFPKVSDLIDSDIGCRRDGSA